jgi:hypothetical protein
MIQLNPLDVDTMESVMATINHNSTIWMNQGDGERSSKLGINLGFWNGNQELHSRLSVEGMTRQILTEHLAGD